MPFSRSRLVVSALIIGSIAPDFEYFVRFTGQDRALHKLPGLLLFTLPLAFLALVVFQVVLRKPMISLLPTGLFRRVSQIDDFRWVPLRRQLLLWFSLCIGIGSHLVWDSFTHDSGWLVELWPMMRVPLIYIRGTALPAYKIAQHLSTIAGLLIVTAYFIRWYRTSPPPSSATNIGQLPRFLRTLVLLSMLAAASGFGGIVAWPYAVNFQGLPFAARLTSGFAMAASSAFVAAVFLFSAIWWARAFMLRRSGRTRLSPQRLSSV